ncbi:MAG: Vitamin B12 transporter BtuB [Candidatus Omnitrophica bacterium]|nr:Vitamin B12 transporter BtuB [Candidatus Omnitrophota bacterium]
MIRLLLCVSACLWAAVSPALAAGSDNKTTVLPTVTVKGQQQGSTVAPDSDAAAVQLKRIPGGVSLVRREDIERGRSSTPQDLLGWVPGLHVQQRDTSSLESRISVRGSGLQRTFHLRGLTLLQDGVPLNQTDGGGDAQRFEPLAIAYTEVYRGGNALRYGSTTLGGAVNFVSPTGYTADPFQARIEGGSFGTVHSQVSSGQVIGPWDYYVSVSQFKQDGYRDHTAQDNYTVMTNSGYKINDSVETRVYTTYLKALSKLGGSLTKSQMRTNPEQANAANVSLNYKRDIEYARLASKTTFTSGERKIDLIGHWSSYELFHPIFQVIYGEDDDWGAEVRYTDANELFGRPNELIVGLSGAVGYDDQDRYTNSGGLPTSRTAQTDSIAEQALLYAEDRFTVVDRLTVVGGGQLLYAERDVNDQFFANGDDSGQVVYRAFNPKIGLVYDLTETSQLFTGYNQSFEPPSFSEMTTPAADFRPNKAQVSKTLEGGARGQEDRWNWDVTLYHSWIDNELLSLNDATGTALGTINAPSETIHKGLELGAGVRLLDRLIVSSDAPETDRVIGRVLYNWSDFSFNGDPVYGDNQLPAFPEHFFKAEVLYEHPSGVYLGPNLEQSFERYPIDFANTFFADPYVIWGFKAGYRQKKGPSFFFEVKNITDEVFAASTGIVTNAAGADSAQFNPGNGRAYYGGAEWRW